MTSLVQDSIEVQEIINLQTRSIETIKSLIIDSEDMPLFNKEEIDLDRVVGDISLSGRSFSPKTRIYNLLVSNNGLELLESNEIKALLINHYDYQYKKI